MTFRLKLNSKQTTKNTSIQHIQKAFYLPKGERVLLFKSCITDSVSKLRFTFCFTVNTVYSANIRKLQLGFIVFYFYILRTAFIAVNRTMSYPSNLQIETQQSFLRLQAAPCILMAGCPLIRCST